MNRRPSGKTKLDRAERGGLVATNRDGRIYVMEGDNLLAIADFRVGTIDFERSSYHLRKLYDIVMLLKKLKTGKD